MNAAATAKQERASRARRWCLRVLTVLGGSIAASVAAWAMTTAVASAEHDSDDNSWFGGSRVVKVGDVVSDGKQAVRDGVHRVDDGVNRVHDELRTNNEPGPAEGDKGGKPGRGNAEDTDDTSNPSTANADGAHDSSAAHNAANSLGLSEHTHGTADRIATMLDSLFALDYQQPGRGDLGLDGTLNDAAHLNNLGDKLDNWFHPAADALPGVPGGIADGAAPMPMPAPSVPAGVGGSVADNSFLADDAAEQAAPVMAAAGGSMDNAADTVAASDVSDSPSDGSPLRLPAGAPAAPSAPANGGATGGHADGSPFAVTFGSGFALIAASATKALTGASVAPFEPGRQPGVTPD